MLTVSNITKQFRGESAPILKNISFTVNAGERVGLIGPNGVGKTTLIQVITGQLSADAGSITFTPPTLRLGYLAQALPFDDVALIRDVLYPGGNSLGEAEAEVERLADALARGADEAFDRLAQAYAEALERLEHFGTVSGDAERVLAGLGLADVPLDALVGTLSGGQKTRLGLAALLLDKPQLLILDEPTNHLDITGIKWLESWLRDFKGGALIVSHDRTFLDQIVTGVLALDEKTHTARFIAGGYSDYVRVVRSEFDKQWAAWRDQQVEIARLEADVRRWKEKALRKENATKNDHQRRLAKKVARRGKAKETRLKQYLDADERVEKPIPAWPLRLGLLEAIEPLPPGREIITLENLSIGYDAAAPLLAAVDLRLLAGERVVVLGPNGQGKSTLLKTIIGELPPLAGRVRIASSVKIGYLAQEQETLDPDATPLSTLQAAAPLNDTEARTFLHFFLFAGDEALRPVRQLSFGERSCLTLAVMVARGANLLVLDEPINHLDVPSRERFEAAMSAYRGSVLAVVHDRYFVDKFATKVWQVENGVLAEEFRTPVGVLDEAYG